MSAPQRIRIWTAPIYIGVISMVGLIAALLSDDGVGDYLAWLSLGIPVAVVLWYAPPRRSQKQQDANTSTVAEHS
jgi:hypothetical protein